MQFMPPYEPIKFPLSDEAFDALLNPAPEGCNYRETKQIKHETIKIPTNYNRKAVGGFGCGRSGLRRQTSNTVHRLRNFKRNKNSLRLRIPDCPHLLNSNETMKAEVTKETVDIGSLKELPINDMCEISNKNSNNSNENNMHYVNGENLIGITKAADMTDDMAEETEDETETCEMDDNMEEVDTEGEMDDDDEENELLDEVYDDEGDDDGDDGFPKHPLAAGHESLHDHIAAATAAAANEQTMLNAAVVDDDDSAYAAYLGRCDMFSERDDSSDAEPFQDGDDPNDPEWSGGRMRKKL